MKAEEEEEEREAEDQEWKIDDINERWIEAKAEKILAANPHLTWDDIRDDGFDVWVVGKTMDEARAEYAKPHGMYCHCESCREKAELDAYDHAENRAKDESRGL